MTRKDYVMLAAVLKTCRSIMLGSTETVDAIVDRLAVELQIDNPRFKIGTFKKAIGIK